MTFRAGLSCGVAVGAVLAATGLAAADFTIVNGQTVGGQVLDNPGDVGIIEAGGTIDAVGVVGVSMGDIDQSVVNDGSITTLGDQRPGIYSLGGGASIVNGGDISTLGQFSYGIGSAGDDARISNSGEILTSDYFADGIISSGANARIGNSGKITTLRDSTYGIYSIGADLEIENSGSITTLGSFSYGIASVGEHASITNSGDIVTSGAVGRAIVSNGAGVRIDNGGAITTSGNGGYAIWSEGADARIFNGGDITTTGAEGFGVSSTGDGARIENTGTIDTTGQQAHTIWSTGSNARIDNRSSLTASGLGAYAIRSDGDDADISNSGLISSTGGPANEFDPAAGIWSTGDRATIGNSGDIVVTGYLATAIVSTGDDARITNSGNVTVSGDGGFALSSFGDNAHIVNSGSVTIDADYADGISSLGDNARIENSGSIAALGYSSYGIFSAGDNAEIRNSGAITTGAVAGIWSEGIDATVINSGRIFSGPSAWAIRFEGTGATLDLRAGTAIQGGIQFDAASTATLNIGPDLNTALTFSGIPATIDSFGAPMAVDPGTGMVAVVDPTGFAAQDEMLTDLTRAIAGAVDGRLNAARFGYAPVSASVTAYVEPDTHQAAFGYGPTDTAADPAATGSGFWAAGIGAYRDQQADGANVGFDTALGGLMVGYDTAVSATTRVGGFLGASAARFRTEGGSQEIDADSYFGGLYAGFTGEQHFLDVALTAGVTQQSSDRSVANNLVEGGIEHAEADYDGVFVSPSVTLGTTVALADGGALIPSIRARYAGLFLDGFDESGSAANLSVDDRDVNVFDLRAQFAWALAARPLDNGALHTAFRAGIDAAFADNPEISTVLLGETLDFSVSGDDTYRVFLGLDLTWRNDTGTSLFLGTEAGYDSGDAFTLDVRGGLRVPL